MQAILPTHHFLALVVKSRSRLVEKEDRRIVENRSGDGDALNKGTAESNRHGLVRKKEGKGQEKQIESLKQAGGRRRKVERVALHAGITLSEPLPLMLL